MIHRKRLRMLDDCRAFGNSLRIQIILVVESSNCNFGGGNGGPRVDRRRESA
jgi:hypothetical protein